MQLEEAYKYKNKDIIRLKEVKRRQIIEFRNVLNSQEDAKLHHQE